MRVALCAGWGNERDGIADYAGYFSNALKESGVDVAPVTLGLFIGDRRWYRRAAAEANTADLCHVQFNYVYFNGIMPYRNMFVYFADRLTKPLVVTAHEVRPELTPLSLAAGASARDRLFNLLLPLWNVWLGACHRQMYSPAARIITHTRGHQALVRTYVDDKRKVVLIPHGIPPVAEGDRRRDPRAAKRALGLEGRTVLTIFGFINSRKGYEVALDALALLPDETALLIAGGPMTDNATDSGYYRLLQEEIGKRHLGSRVRITGYLTTDRVPDVMAATDICLAPFASDAASGALSLCIAYHKPVVASDTPVNREICERVPCLDLFPGGNADVLAERARRLAGDESGMRGLALRAGEYAAQFSYDRIAAMTAKVYDDALGRGAGGCDVTGV